MILIFLSDWNLTMTIGAVLAFTGVFLCIWIVSYCTIRMEFDLKAHYFKIPMFHFYKHFIVYREYNRRVKLTSEGPEKEKLNRKIVLTNQVLFITPTIIIIGLLILIIEKNL